MMPRKPSTPALADDHAAPGGAAAVDRALSLLAAYRADDGPLPLATLAARTHLYKSTALRLLASLVHAGLLRRQDDGRYALGVEVARLHRIYQQQFSLADVVLPVLRQLVPNPSSHRYRPPLGLLQKLGLGRQLQSCCASWWSPPVKVRPTMCGKALRQTSAACACTGWTHPIRCATTSARETCCPPTGVQALWY